VLIDTIGPHNQVPLSVDVEITVTPTGEVIGVAGLLDTPGHKVSIGLGARFLYTRGHCFQPAL
jgi:hypothetical protein